MTPTKCPHCSSKSITLIRQSEDTWKFRCRTCNFITTNKQRHNKIEQIIKHPELSQDIIIDEDEFEITYPPVSTNWGDEPEYDTEHNNISYVEIPRPEENGPLDNAISEIGVND